MKLSEEEAKRGHYEAQKRYFAKKRQFSICFDTEEHADVIAWIESQGRKKAAAIAELVRKELNIEH